MKAIIICHLSLLILAIFYCQKSPLVIFSLSDNKLQSILTKEKILTPFFFKRKIAQPIVYQKEKHNPSLHSIQTTNFLLQVSNPVAVSLVLKLQKKKKVQTRTYVSTNKGNSFQHSKSQHFIYNLKLRRKNITITFLTYIFLRILKHGKKIKTTDTIADARRAKQKISEKALVNEISRSTEKNEETNENIYTNKTLEIKKDNENKELNVMKKKLKQHYQSQDKLSPLFDNPEQSIDTCYIRLTLLIQQQFHQQKDKMVNNQEKRKSKEENGEKNGKWTNSLDYSLIYGNQTENIELQDIWNDKQKGLKICHIGIRGEAGSGKSVLSQRVVYLWGNGQMLNHQFQYLLHIPLRKIINGFYHINDNCDDQRKDQTIVNELHIPQWDLNDTKCIINSMNGLLLLLGGFDGIANEIQNNTIYNYGCNIALQIKDVIELFMDGLVD
ncbi:hypothetical protein RFI_25677 [Reticulomyxa filosa]|uniref:NACHT domain-containing protein n=1 Tax=Reticulomyxa filosa TaxID=46433 RepID=X6MCT8_RETFI|nr:hypothetical protein RFI_25677 [Reticulomyxa filosa]|eukprot:ETO11699.1 hypothetical protein RFI_25677 [Reticulomyxa filosa]